MSEVPWAQAGGLLAETHMCYRGRKSSGNGCHEDLENEHRAKDSKSPGSHSLLQTGTSGNGGRWLGRDKSIISQKEKDDSGLRSTVITPDCSRLSVPSNTWLLMTTYAKKNRYYYPHLKDKYTEA